MMLLANTLQVWEEVTHYHSWLYHERDCMVRGYGCRVAFGAKHVLRFHGAQCGHIGVVEMGWVEEEFALAVSLCAPETASVTASEHDHASFLVQQLSNAQESDFSILHGEDF